MGLALFTLTAAGSALAPSIDALLALRLVQGASAGAVGILPRAIIRDLFEGREARLHLAAVSLVFSVAPLIAPTLGAGILFVGSWRLIFAVLTAVGAIVVTAALSCCSGVACRREPPEPQAFDDLRGYRRALTNPACAGFSLLGGLLFAGLFAYVNVSPLLYMQGYGVSKTGFAGLFAITASGVIVGSTHQRLAPQPPCQAEGGGRRRARGRMSASALALLAVGLAGLGSALIVAALVMVYISAFGLIYPNAAHEAVHPLPEIAGLASAVLITIADAVRRARRHRRRRALPRRLAGRPRRHHERRRPRRRRPLRVLVAGQGWSLRRRLTSSPNRFPHLPRQP